MKRYFSLLLIVLLCPAPGGHSHTARSSANPERVAAPHPLAALDTFRQRLADSQQPPEHHGLLVETLEGGQTLADHNADITFNPASVMKLATSLAALRKFAPDHRFRTNFRAAGHFDPARRTLEGDLVVEGGADPLFSLYEAQQVAAELGRLGVARVTGNLRFAGPFYYYARGYTSNLSRETSAAKLRRVLEGAGIRILGETVFGGAEGELLLSHYSDELIRLLQYQNAFSSNAVAEVIGEAVGGPSVLQEFLLREVGLRDAEVYVGRTSGLGFNRMTPRASLKILRALLIALDRFGLGPEAIMPVAGIDSGTLRGRLAAGGLRGSVIAKTGTLVTVDNGVSTLVGIARTRRGPLLFALFNSAGSVYGYRRMQDQFLEEMIEERGGAGPVERSEDALAIELTGITQPAGR